MLRSLLISWLMAVSLASACGTSDTSVARQQTSPSASAPVAVPGRTSPRTDGGAGIQPAAKRSDVGFRTRAQFDEHFQKHGAEFGRVSQQEYLRKAQTLRDAPVSANIEEIRRNDGTVSRFDRSTGAFVAFNRDGTIRTFFKPNDGEAYFRRQASRVQ